MKMISLKSAFCLFLSFLLSCSLLLGTKTLVVSAEASESQSTESGETSSSEKEGEKDVSEKTDPRTLSAEEREKGVLCVWPLGLKYALPEILKDEHVKVRTDGIHADEEDRLYTSRGFYFRPQASLDLAKDIRFEYDATENRENYKKRMDEEVLPFDLPLFKVVNLRSDKLPESEEEREKLFREELEKASDFAKTPVKEIKKLLEEDGLSQYLLIFEDPETPLATAEDAELFKTVREGCEELLKNMQSFRAEKSEESFPKVEKWTFEGTDYNLSDEPITDAILKNAKLTYVVYWTTWCPDCHNELKFLGEQLDFLEEHDIQLLGIVKDVKAEEIDEDVLAEAHKVIDERGLTDAMPVMLDSDELEDGLFIRALNIPTTFFVDGEGKIYRAYVEPDTSKWQDEALAVLAEMDEKK